MVTHIAKPEISLFFPVYNDELTVHRVTEKAVALLKDVASAYEILIIDDGSPDRSGAIADELAKECDHVRVIHHPHNMGYGTAVQAGLRECRYEWILFTDGDDEYDINEFYKLLELREFYDLIITFRYVRLYSGFRQVLSWGYNVLFRFLFRTHTRDISTGLRMMRRSLLPKLALTSTSPFIGAELTLKTMLKGYRIGEVGIQTFPRKFGKGTSTSWKNVVATFRDMIVIYRTVFSSDYDMPVNRSRD